MKRLLLLICLSLRIAWSEETVEENAQKAYLANVNALMVFTSQNGLNSGTYEFTRANATMNVIHLGDSYNFDPFRDNFNLFVVGGGGYSETTMTVDINATDPKTDGIKLTTTNMLQTFTGGIGGGVRYSLQNGFEMLGGMEVIYSRVGVRNRDDENGVGEIVEDFFKGKYNDNISYRFFTRTEYRPEFEGFNPYVTVSYELYETKSAFSFEQLSSFSSQSHVTSFAFGSETPPIFRYDAMYLTLEGYLRGSYLGGDLARVAKLDGYGIVGGTAYWYVTETFNYFRRFYLDISTIQADGLRGYNVGLGFSVGF